MAIKFDIQEKVSYLINAQFDEEAVRILHGLVANELKDVSHAPAVDIDYHNKIAEIYQNLRYAVEAVDGER